MARDVVCVLVLDRPAVRAVVLEPSAPAVSVGKLALKSPCCGGPLGLCCFADQREVSHFGERLCLFDRLGERGEGPLTGGTALEPRVQRDLRNSSRRRRGLDVRARTHEAGDALLELGR